jgi:hypothetical protein
MWEMVLFEQNAFGIKVVGRSALARAEVLRFRINSPVAVRELLARQRRVS